MFYNKLSAIVYPVVTNVNKDCVAIDNFAAQDFFDNAAGWTRNDLAQLAAAKSKEEYMMIVERLSQRDGKFNMSDKDSIADGIKRTMSRYCQSPLEIAEFAERLANEQLVKASNDAYKNALKQVDSPSDQNEPNVKTE